MSKFTRRALVAAVSTSAVVLARPQAAPQALPSNPDQELKAALAQHRANADQLDSFMLPMSTEPVTIFKA